MKLYLTKQNRYGDFKQHTYISWIYSNRIVAEIHGVYHGKFTRGGKYECEIIEMDYPGRVSYVWLLEFNMNQESSPFRYSLYSHSDILISLPIRDLVDFNCFKVDIVNDLEIDKDNRDDYEWLLSCDGLLSPEAKVYLRDKLIDVVLKMKEELTQIDDKKE